MRGLTPFLLCLGLLVNLGTSLLRIPSKTLLHTSSLSPLQYASFKVDKDDSTGKKEYSFVNDDLRAYAMKLHTKSQAPKEGQAPEKERKPYSVTRMDYVHFLRDSLTVYETFEEIMRSGRPELEPFQSTGLDRSQALRTDLQWLTEYDKLLFIPECGVAGTKYSSVLNQIVNESIPKFMCHYYNHYFAHTAGGQMIGKRMAKDLLEGKTLEFYKWEGNVRELLEATKKKVDELALTWSQEEKQACMEETENVFRYSGGLMVYFKDPAER